MYIYSVVYLPCQSLHSVNDLLNPKKYMYIYSVAYLLNPSLHREHFCELCLEVRHPRTLNNNNQIITVMMMILII
jgi:hypothetical protein